MYKTSSKKTLITALVCCIVILFSALIGSFVQTAGWTASIQDLRDVSNSGTKTIVADDTGEAKDYVVNGKIVSGILIIPKNATKDTPVPAIVFTHGMYNNREMQLQFGIELARRGFVTLMIDREKHGHNDELTYQNTGDCLLSAAKYLYNLTDKDGNIIVDRTKIAVSGHSFGGMATNNALSIDGVDTKGRVKVDGQAYMWPGATEEALSNGYHMGIISAGLVQACTDSPKSYASNLLGVGNIKGNADDLYDNCTTKNPVYAAIARDKVTSVDFANAVKGKYVTSGADGHLYVKKGNNFVAVTDKDRYNQSTQYYRFSTTANCLYYLQSSKAMTFAGIDMTRITEEQYNLINGGLYDYNTGSLVKAPDASHKYISDMTKGQQVANKDMSLRVYYESRNIHTMIPFSTQTAGEAADFFYNVYGVPSGARFISPNAQTWWIKEGVAGLGIIALFGIMLCLVDILLKTRLFGSLVASDGEITQGPAMIKTVRKQIFYWLTAALTGIFGVWCYCSKLDGWYADSIWKGLIENTTDKFTGVTYLSWTTVARLSYWGICCAIFAICLTAFFWLVNRIINMIVHKDDYMNYDEHPFAGFKMRSVGNVFKTVLLAGILVATFYGIVNVLWKTMVVDFRIWTFDIRVFKTDRLLSYLRYVPYFLIYYVVMGALSQNYRVKDLPEWVTTAINVFVNVGFIMIVVWYSNNYSMNIGVVTNSITFRNYCYTYPLIPTVALATIFARRVYLRTGNAWLAALVNATLCAIITCANNSIGI